MTDLRSYANPRGTNYMIIERMDYTRHEKYFEVLKYNVAEIKWDVVEQSSSLSDIIANLSKKSNSISFTVEFRDF